MIIDFKSLDLAKKYHTMTQTIIPRPIAWALTRNAKGALNLAPFSYFNAISSDPPLVVLSIGSKADGSLKDTRRNFLETKEMVIHIAHEKLAELVTQSAADFPAEVSEVESLGLNYQHLFGDSHLPVLTDCRVAFRCTYYDSMEIGPRKQGILFAEIQELYLDDSVCKVDQDRDRLYVLAEKIQPLARLGGNQYATFGQVKEVRREPYAPQ